jgi:MFS family permease
LVRFSDRVGKGIRTAPRDALIAESVDLKYRGAAFGYHRAADHAGAVLGPLAAAAVLMWKPGAYRLVFALAAVPALLSVLVLAARVRDVGEGAPPTKSEFRGYRGLGRRFYIFSLGNATDAFLLLRAQELGVPLALIPILWAVFHVSKMSWSIIGGRLADRIGPRPAIVSGWVVYALTYTGFILAARAWHAWALFLFYGLFYGLTEAPEKALVAAAAPPDRRGAAFGASALPASLLFGVLWQQVSSTAAFATGAALALAAATGLLFLPAERAPRIANSHRQ